MPNVPNVTWHVPLGAPCHNRVGDIETSKKWKKFGVQSWSGDHVQVAMLIVSVRTRRPRGLRLGCATDSWPSLRETFSWTGISCVRRGFRGSPCHLHLPTMGSRLAPEHSLELPHMACSGAVYILVFSSYSPRKGGSRVLTSYLRRVTHLGVDQCLPHHTQPFLDNHPGFMSHWLCLARTLSHPFR